MSALSCHHNLILYSMLPQNHGQTQILTEQAVSRLDQAILHGLQEQEALSRILCDEHTL